MQDITMCHGTNCEVRNQCYRFTATPSENWQSYFEGVPKYDSGCDDFLPIKETKDDECYLKIKEIKKYYIIVGLKEECEKKGVSMACLANKLEISRSYLCDLSKGRRYINQEMFIKIKSIISGTEKKKGSKE